MIAEAVEARIRLMDKRSVEGQAHNAALFGQRLHHLIGQPPRMRTERIATSVRVADRAFGDVHKFPEGGIIDVGHVHCNLEPRHLREGLPRERGKPFGLLAHILPLLGRDISEVAGVVLELRTPSAAVGDTRHPHAKTVGIAQVFEAFVEHPLSLDGKDDGDPAVGVCSADLGRSPAEPEIVRVQPTHLVCCVCQNAGLAQVIVTHHAEQAIHAPFPQTRQIHLVGRVHIRQVHRVIAHLSENQAVVVGVENQEWFNSSCRGHDAPPYCLRDIGPLG